MFYLFLSQRDLSGRLAAVETQLSQNSVVAEPEPAASASPDPLVSASPSPDLGSPESRDKKRKEDLKLIKAALSEYREVRDRYPTELAEVQGEDLSVIPSDPLSPKYRY